MVRLSILFGLFQALMPLLGWLGTTWLAEYIEAYDHWVAFGMLAFLGGRMIRDAFRPEEEHHFDPKNWWTGIVLAVAYVLFKKKYYHLHEEYLASLKK